MLDVLHASALFFLESSPLLLEALGTGSSMGLELLLMVLIDAELGKFELALLVLAQQGHLLRFTLELGLVLLNQGVFILLKLDLALFIEPVLFFPDQLLLFFLVLAEGALRFDLELVLVVLHLVAQHASTVLVLHLDFVLQLGELLLVLALLLLLDLQDLSVCLLLELPLLFLQLALELSLQVLELVVVLSLDLSLLGLEALDVAALAIELLVLLIFEFLYFEFITLALTLLHSLPDPLIAAGKLQLLGLQLLI